MEKTRKVKIISLCALLVAVLGLTVAFASLSQMLTINGSANVDASSWNVHFKDNIETATNGSAKILSKPTLTSNALGIENFEISLTKPGDMVIFTMYVENSGTIGANLTDIIINGFSINDISNGNVNEDDAFASVFVEADWDGDGITTKEERDKTMQNIIFDRNEYDMPLNSYDQRQLPAESQGKIELSFLFNPASTELPKGNIKINANMQYIFTQY